MGYPIYENLASIMADIITSGALDGLESGSDDFQHLSRSRLGYCSNHGLAEMIFDELQKEDLHPESGDDKTVKLHPMVRSFGSYTFISINKTIRKQIGIDLNPVTDRHRLVGSLKDLLSIPESASSGNVISFDLNTVSVDVGAVPIKDVLEFREENFEAYKNYQGISSYLYELSPDGSRGKGIDF